MLETKIARVVNEAGATHAQADRLRGHKVQPAASDLPGIVLTYDPDGPDDGRWVVAETYVYHHAPTVVHIVEGFRFDGASVPRLVRPLIGIWELSAVAPTVHDLLYRNGGVLPDATVSPRRTWTRKEADQEFLWAMRREGVPGWRCRAAYWAVRAFGWMSAWQGK